MKLQHQWTPSHNPCNSFTPRGKHELNYALYNGKNKKKEIKPDPLGKKSRPTMLSKTEDFPELCSNFKRNKKKVSFFY